MGPCNTEGVFCMAVSSELTLPWFSVVETVLETLDSESNPSVVRLES